MSPAVKRHYRPEIDGLRAIAVLPVILFHAGFEPFGGGFVGVDIFFVISGYLITSIIIREAEAGRFSLLHFYERRARRILPALTLVVLASIPFAWVLLVPDDMADFLASIVAVCFFVSNFFFWQESDYFDDGTESDPLIHTWSLSVEEQFYLLFPLLLLFLLRSPRLRTRSILLAMFVASLVLAHWSAYTHPDAAFFLLPSRLWELGIGVMLALGLPGGAERLSASIRQCLGLVGLALIAFAIFAFDKMTPFPSLYALVPTVGAALVIAFATPATYAGALLASRPLVGVGLISYSAYLWHQPIFVFGRYGSMEPVGDGIMLLLALLALALAYLTWRFVEVPFRQPERIKWSSMIALASVTGAALLTFSVSGLLTDDFTAARLTKAHSALLQTAEESKVGRRCNVDLRSYATLGEPCAHFDSTPSWAVLGNSHGIELALALGNRLREFDDGVQQLTINTCSPGLDLAKGEENCKRWTEDALDFLFDEKHIRNVVISFRMIRDDGVFKADKMQKRVRGADSYLALIRRVSAAGKRVFVVLQAPMLEEEVEWYIWKATISDTLDFVRGADREIWGKSMAAIHDRLDELPKNVAVVDPADLFCRQSACAMILKGKALYYDDNHMSLSGAALVADEIIRRASLAAPAGKHPES